MTEHLLVILPNTFLTSPLLKLSLFLNLFKKCVSLLMKVTAHFSSLLISVRPFTLLITIHSFHGSITASAYVATFYRGLTYTSLTGLNSSAFAVYPPTKRLALVECVKAPLLGQSCTLRPSPLSLNHTTPASNNMQTIHSFILLSFCSEPFSLSLSLSLSVSKVVLLTIGPGFAIKVWPSTQIKRARFLP
jgi:hypothetical protein